MADLPAYGLDPSIVSYLQGGGMPPGGLQQIGTDQGTVSDVPLQMPRGSTGSGGQHVGDTVSAPDETPNYGIHPDLVSAVQNGFAPGLSLPPPAAPQSNAGAQFAAPPVTPQTGVDLANVLTGTASATPAAAISPQSLTPTQTPVASPPAQQETPKQRAARLAFETSPEGVAEKADAEQRAALAKEGQANADALAAEQAQNAATLNALDAHNARLAEQQKADQAKAAQDQANVAKYTQLYGQQIRDAANFKVNTNRNIGMTGLIAIALSGIGDALDHQHGPNKALEIINNAIDKNIADQWAQKKALGDTAEMTKSELDVYRRNADDDRQAQEFQRAAESTKLADEIRQIGAQYANPAAKARAETLAAALDQKAAGITAGEAQRKAQALREQQEDAFRRQQLGVSYGELALRRQEHADQLAQNDRDFALHVAELTKSDDQAAAKQLLAQRQAVTERGMFLPTGGLNSDGTAHREPITNQDGSPFIASEKAEEKIGPVKSAVIDGVNQIDDMRKLRQNFSSADQFENWITTTDEGRKLLQKQAKVILDLHEASGINRFSGEVVDLSKKILTGGPDATSAKALYDRLGDAREMMIDGLDSKLRGEANYTGKPLRSYFPDPMAAQRTEPLGVQITQPQPSSVASPSARVAPQTNAPSVIDNFYTGPRPPTIATPMTPNSSIHDWIAKHVIEKKR